LVFDTKHAVEEQTRFGIIPFCASLDPSADDYVKRIFGARNYRVLGHLRPSAGKTADALHAADQLTRSAKRCGPQKRDQSSGRERMLTMQAVVSIFSVRSPW
jgi:hypothetical protein